MREKAEERFTEFKNGPFGMFQSVRELKINTKDVEGGGCIRGSDVKLCFHQRERGKVWKGNMKTVIDGYNGWTHNVEGDEVEGQFQWCVRRDEVVQVLKDMKTGIALDR